MSTLFNNNNSESGYRLRSMEIFNWGTFHGKVFKLLTNGRTSLLTGANGSGKTTLIDALLTILVPSNKRFYNQSSGAEIKKERDENSYFWGFHGKTYSETDEKSKTEQLRSKSDNPYSVLLASFQNAGTLHTVTLVQVRWFSGGSMKKVFIVSPYQLTITDNFGKGQFDIKGEWKKKLKKQYPKTDLFDSFKDYAARFSDLFGLKEKALSLFNQTVGIKVLGDLTQFIRQQMLEEPEAEEQFKSLYDHYTDLLISHKAIQKDEKQLELLEPIVTNKERLEGLEKEMAVLVFIEQQLPFFFDKIEFNLLDKHIDSLEKDITFLEQKKEETEHAIKQDESDKSQLIAQKASLNIDNQVQLLTKDISIESEKRDSKKKIAQDYIRLATTLGLHTTVKEDSFRENQLQIEQLSHSIENDYAELNEKKFRYKADQERISIQIDKVQENITSYLSRRNRILPELITVRERLLDLLETGEDELPFAGELIKVKADARHWEDVIERVLHNFSLQLLVPERFNKQVNHFVHSNNLRAKLVYQRIDKKSNDSIVRWPTENDYLVNKLELKESGQYTTWLEKQLLERFNYYCTDDLDVFYGSQKAVTSNGLIRNISRHEKDDRANKWSKLSYTLGWDSKETVQLLLQEKKTLETEHTKIFNLLQEINPKIKSLDAKRPLITLLSDIKSFNEINWEQHAVKIDSLQRKIEALESSSDQYKTVSKQLEELEIELEQKRKNNEEYIRKLSKLEDECNRMNLRKFNIQFDDLTTEGIGQIESFFAKEKVEGGNPATLEQLSLLKSSTAGILKSHVGTGNKAINKVKEETIGLIARFVNPTETILREFPEWSGDVMNISPQFTSLDELEDLYKTIRNQRLVEHKRRFREYMDKSMLDALTNYRTWLNNEEEKIKEIIEELNVPLKKITFNKNPDTYLQLECKTTREQEIKIFRDQLSSTIPSVLEFSTQKDEAYRERVFQNIKVLITELQQEETWRRKVTDIRNWLSFNAREYTFAENKAGQYHDNTASYSGGQKAQFTYAILGAAIAHQFGIFQPGKQHKSLRFITVDEAFSKLDPEKSQFLMEFCAQLNLQILVVTPLDKINIAEPYIHAVHFVEIKNKKHSIVYNLTMEEYNERKEEFKQIAENSG